MMAAPTSTFTEVQHKSNQGAGASLSVSISTPTASNILFAYGMADKAITDPSGWTLIDSSSIAGTASAQPRFCKTWWKSAAGTETSLALAATSATIMLGGVSEINGPTGIGAHKTVTASAQWYQPSDTFSPGRGSALAAVAFFGFKSNTTLPWDSGHKTLPTPGNWFGGIGPTRAANSIGLQGIGRPFIQASGSGMRAAQSAHFGINLASFGGSQTYGYLHDWWLEASNPSPGESNLSFATHIVEFLVATNSVALYGSGSLSASGGVSATATAALSGSGSLSASAKPAVPKAVALSGSGSLTATGVPKSSGTASLSGSGSLSVARTAGTSGSVSLSGSGSLSAAAKPAMGVSLALTGSGTLAASSGLVTAVPLSGSGSLSAAVSPSLSKTVALSGAGSLAASAKPSLVTAIALSGSGALTAGTVPGWAASVPLSGSGALTLFHQGVITAALSGSGVLTLANPARDITVTAVLEPRRWDAGLSARPTTAALHPRRWEAT